jgi:hypothetical protein
MCVALNSHTHTTYGVQRQLSFTRYKITYVIFLLQVTDTSGMFVYIVTVTVTQLIQ